MTTTTATADALILAAAREVIAERGMSGVALATVATRACMDVRVISNRYPDLRSLVTAALADLEVSETARRLAYDASLCLRTLRDMPGGAFLAEIAAATDGRDEFAEALWPVDGE